MQKCEWCSGDASEALGYTVVEMRKEEKPGYPTVVWFTPTEDGKVRIYTWGWWTDYTTLFIETIEEARASWKSLQAKGFRRTA